MWSLDDVSIEIEEAEGRIALVRVDTPFGTLKLMGHLHVESDCLIVTGAHVQGLDRGALGRSGLNAIGRKLLVISNVRQIIIYGGIRSTGRNAGRKSRPIRFPA